MYKISSNFAAIFNCDVDERLVAAVNDCVLGSGIAAVDNYVLMTAC